MRRNQLTRQMGYVFMECLLVLAPLLLMLGSLLDLQARTLRQYNAVKEQFLRRQHEMSDEALETAACVERGGIVECRSGGGEVWTFLAA